MAVAVVRLPSCIDAYSFQSSPGPIEQMTVQNKGTELAFYYRDLAPGESKRVSVTFLQKYWGTCQLRTHSAFLYYSPESL